MSEDVAKHTGEFISTLLNMPVGRASVVCIAAAGTFGTGTLAVFTYWPTLFATLAFSKILLLSFAITAPFIAFGTFTLQLGFAAKHRRTLVEGLGPRFAVATVSHSLMSLLAMGVGGFHVLLGTASSMHVSVFWGYSALYAYAMAVLGFHDAEKNKSPMLKLSIPIALWSAYFIVSIVGDHLGWWNLLAKK